MTTQETPLYIYVTGFEEAYEPAYLIVYHRTRAGAEQRVERLEDDVREGYGYGIPFLREVRVVE